MIDVSSINEGSRQRKQYKNIDSLAESIKAKGLINPILVRKSDMTLVAGGRRLRAIKAADLKEIPDDWIKWTEDIDQIELKELELIENLEREDLTWQEEIAAKAELDKLKKEQHGDCQEVGRDGWSTRKSAALVGTSVGGFSQDVSLHHAIQEIPELAECETKAEAQRSFRKMFDRYQRQQTLKSAEEEEQNRSIKYAKDHFQLGDARERLKAMGKTMVYFCEVDPPYGIDLVDQVLNKPERAKAETHKQYIEVPREKYIEFCADIAGNIYRIIGDDCWMIWWFAWEHYENIYQLLTEIGFKVDRVPGIWYKIHTAHASQNAKFLPSRDFEQFLLCRKGKPIIEKAHGGMYVHQGVSSQNRTCSAEKPVELYQEIIQTLIPKGVKCIGLVPFLGSGNCLRALYREGHTGFGYDQSEANKEYFLTKVLEDQEGGLI